MDSLSQIVLGAAVGEAALGKKVGNRAMVWGAIAGTIPDLDVISNLFMSQIDSLAFHRGITHSIPFCVAMAVVLAYLVKNLYTYKHHKWLGIVGWSILLALGSMAILFIGNFSWVKLIVALLSLVGFGYLIYKRYHRESYDTPSASVGQWIIMFLWSLITHPILDCFTTYGTQILTPFSSQRIAWNNIAVADPAYTLPFLICLLLAMTLNKENKWRRFWNNTGLIISSLYMVFTIYNKTRINTIFEQTLAKENIQFSRYMTTPSILNNVLWSGIAESDSSFHYGMYSFFDKDKKFKLNSIKKTDAKYKNVLQNDKTLQTLQWFSSDYFKLQPHPTNADTLEYFDLRFGTFRTSRSKTESFVFKFKLYKDEKGNYQLKDQGETPRDANVAEVFGMLWDRIKGI